MKMSGVFTAIPARLFGVIGVDPTSYDVAIDKIYGGYDLNFEIRENGDKHELWLQAGNAVSYETSGGAVTLKLKLTNSNGGFTHQVILIEINDVVGGAITGTVDADILFGDKGANTIQAHGGDDIIFAQGGGDTIEGNKGTDIIDGGAGADIIIGGAGDDYLYGGGGDDTLRGGGDADVLFGGAGSDTLTGGAGSDQFVVDLDVTSRNDTDSVTDFNINEDQLRIIYRTHKLEQTLIQHVVSKNDLGQYGVRVNAGIIYKIVEADDDIVLMRLNANIANAEFIIALNGGTDADDLILGGAYGDVLQGFGGDDTIYGVAGANIIHGGAGSDKIYGGVHDDILFGGYDPAPQAAPQAAPQSAP